MNFKQKWNSSSIKNKKVKNTNELLLLNETRMDTIATKL